MRRFDHGSPGLTLTGKACYGVSLRSCGGGVGYRGPLGRCCEGMAMAQAVRIWGHVICRVCGNVKGYTCTCKERDDD